MSFMPLEEICSDFLNSLDDFFHRGGTIGAISPVHLVKLCFQSCQLLIPLTPNQISNHVARRGETAFFPARFNPGSLVLR